MKRSLWRGLVCCISLAVAATASAQDVAPNTTEEPREPTFAQLNVAVNESESTLERTRDEAQVEFELRKQIAELQEQLRAARETAEREREEEAAERERDAEAAERERDEEAAEREREEEAAERERDAEAAEREREEEAAERERDAEAAEREREEEAAERDSDEAQEALHQRDSQEQIAELQEQLQAAREGAEREEAGNVRDLHHAINELRGEVQQLRMELQELRKLLEPRPAANEGAHRALRREDLFHIRSRVAGEVVRLGSIGGDGNEGRSFRAGDVVRKGQVLAVVCCDEISEKQNDLIEALQRLDLDRQQCQQLEKMGREVVPTRQIIEAQRAVTDDEIAVERLERTLRTWHVDEADLAAIRDQAQRHAAGDPQTDKSEQSLPWGQVKVLAPVDGVVLERNVSQGELIQLDANLFILLAADPSDTAKSLQ